VCGPGWRRITNEGGQDAYLAPNEGPNGTIPPATPAAGAAQTARWTAWLPSGGEYRVEAFVPAHGPLAWECPPALLAGDTASARYTVRHAGGEETVVANQAAASGEWLLLGVYSFAPGTMAQVTLVTLTDEAAATRTVAASALRLTWVADRPAPQMLHLPQVSRR
jgi:hypothetical protein